MPEWGFTDSVADFTGVDRDTASADALFNPFAAVPSMHVAFALMLGFTMVADRRAAAGRRCCGRVPAGRHVRRRSRPPTTGGSTPFLGAAVAAVSAVAAAGAVRPRAAGRVGVERPRRPRCRIAAPR